MFDNYKDNQKIAYKILKNALDNNKISHAYLIETLGNKKGFDFALSFAKALLCPKGKTNNKECKNCNQCKLIDDNNFIELEIVDTDQMWLKKENITKLQKDFSFKPIIGSRKIYIIKNVEKIKENLANTLLKFIEEPEEGIIAILIAENQNKILNTIVSRCQIISLKNYDSDKEKDSLKEYAEDIINISLEFVNHYEKYGKETLIYTNKLLHDKLKDRIDYISLFDIMILYYNDILNFKLEKKNKIFGNFEKEILENSKKLTITNILEKLDILMSLRKKIENNINLNLLIDKLILSFEKVNNNE